MVKANLTTLILGAIIIILTIFFVTDKRKISSQKTEISDLEDQIETLEKKVKDVEAEKKEVEDKNAALLEITSRSYQSSTSIPIYPSPSFTPNSSEPLFQNNLQTQSSKGFGVVVYRLPSCDYFIIENSMGYIIAEWMGGYDPDLGDKISGDLNSYGTKDFYDLSRDRDCRFWIDDFMLSKDDALDKIREKCN